MKTAFLLILAAALTLAGCASKSVSVPDQREAILKMRNETLTELYKAKPEAKQKIETSAGYAVFSTYGVTVVVVGGAGGNGVATNNQSKLETFMQEGSASVGLGLGGAEVRTVFIFSDPQAFDNFVTRAGSLAHRARCRHRQETKAVPQPMPIAFSKSTEIYQLGKNALMAQATIAGTKFWKDKDLN